MDLEKFVNQWKTQEISPQIETKVLNNLLEFDGKIKQENTRITYLLAGTIFLLGSFLIPFISGNEIAMYMVGALFFVMGGQSLLFWLRTVNVNHALLDQPEKFIDKQIQKLKYSLTVTNVIMPIYTLLIGGISTIYLSNVLVTLRPTILYLIIGGIWAFFSLVFILSWKRQRKKDQTIIIPLLQALKIQRAEYQAGKI